MHGGTQTEKMQFDTDAQKIQKEAHSLIAISTELPFDAENLKGENEIFGFSAAAAAAVLPSLDGFNLRKELPIVFIIGKQEVNVYVT